MITLIHFWQEYHGSDLVSLLVHLLMVSIYPISDDINFGPLNELMSTKFLYYHEQLVGRYFETEYPVFHYVFPN